MMLGRFSSHVHLKTRAGLHYWGWCAETKIADSWYLGMTFDLRPDEEPQIYLSSKDVTEINPCSAELCEELNAILGEQPEEDAETFASALQAARWTVTSRKTGGVL